MRAATPIVLANEPEQDVLGADVVVSQRKRFTQRQLEDLLGARRERDLTARDLVALADDARDLRPHLFDRDVEGLEHPRRETLFFAEQPEQDVLGADVVVLERPRLVLRENHNLPSPFSKAFEQVPSTLLSRDRLRGAPNGRPQVEGSPHPSRRSSCHRGAQRASMGAVIGSSASSLDRFVRSRFPGMCRENGSQASSSSKVSWISPSKLAGTTPSAAAYSRRKYK